MRFQGVSAVSFETIHITVRSVDAKFVLYVNWFEKDSEREGRHSLILPVVPVQWIRLVEC